MSRKPDPKETERAIKPLLVRAVRLHRRAARARVDSNERKKCLAQAYMLRACAEEIATDKVLQLYLRKSDLVGRGWRATSTAVIEFVQKRQKLGKRAVA